MILAQYPTAEQIEELLAGSAETPVGMVNLLRFEERAFVEIVNDPRVRAIGAHRAAGLGGQCLIATTAGSL